MMYIKNRLRMLYFIFLAFFTLTISAQNNYQKGYVVTNQNDTLFGEVSDRKEGPFGGIHEKIRLKGKGIKKRFSSKKIRTYTIGKTTFRSLLLDGDMTFVRVVSEGYVNHYVYELQEQGEQLVLDIDYFQKGENGDLVRVTQGLFGLKKRRLVAFFKDCPPLQQKIKNKEFKYAFEVANFYNNWKSEQ